MYKMMFLVRRKPGLTKEEFREHYEAFHAPWGIRKFNGGFVKKYVRNHIGDGEGRAIHPWGTPGDNEAAFDFDVIVEFWFEDQASHEAWKQWKPTQPLGELLAADEFSFFDTETAVCLFVEEIEELRDEPSERPAASPPLAPLPSAADEG